MKIIIPARKGSKGLPLKNRKLFKYTADIIPISSYENVYVLTDDKKIAEVANSYEFNVVDRPRKVSNDLASTKSLIEYFLSEVKCKKNEPLIILYLTYPERKWDHVIKALKFFNKKKLESMLCKKEIEWTPFLVLKEEDNGKGSQLFYHELYRRQDYPKCFEISHYISILIPDHINKLNDNLYNKDTVFMPIDDVIDVDTKKDLNDFLNE
jgi:N-acylneuraminate cytidylyltransferase